MDTMQPWNNMGQGFFRQRPFNRTQTDQSAGQTHEQQNPPDTTQQVEWLSGLSREEKLEAKRLALQASFSFEGYQVVRREFISHQFDPAMTVRWTGITFNNACISKLEDATYIHFLINPTEMKLLIRSVSEGARDAVRWCIVKGDKRKSRKISCKPFTERLYDMMGWNPQYRYKMQGMKIKYRGEDMYLFDLNAVECFVPQHRDPKTGKVPRAQAILPKEWENSYGMSVEEHSASTQVDLESGYTDAMSRGQDKTEQRQVFPDHAGEENQSDPAEHHKQNGMEGPGPAGAEYGHENDAKQDQHPLGNTEEGSGLSAPEEQPHGRESAADQQIDGNIVEPPPETLDFGAPAEGMVQTGHEEHHHEADAVDDRAKKTGRSLRFQQEQYKPGNGKQRADTMGDGVADLLQNRTLRRFVHRPAILVHAHSSPLKRYRKNTTKRRYNLMKYGFKTIDRKETDLIK